MIQFAEKHSRRTPPEDLRTQVRYWLARPVPTLLAVQIEQGYGPASSAPDKMKFGHVMGILADYMGTVAEASERVERIFDGNTSEVPNPYLNTQRLEVHDNGEPFLMHADDVLSYRKFFALLDSVETLAGKGKIDHTEMQAHRAILSRATHAFEQAEEWVRQEKEIMGTQAFREGSSATKVLSTEQVEALQTAMREYMKPGLVEIQQAAVGRGVLDN